MYKSTGNMFILLCLMALMAYALSISGCGSGGGDTAGTSGFGSSENTQSTILPKVSGCAPSNLTSGTILTITGTGFGTQKRNATTNQVTDTVTFVKTGIMKDYSNNAVSADVLNATSYLSWTDTQIICVSPNLTASEKYIVVIRTVTDFGTYTSAIDSTSNADVITAVTPFNQPSITSISPNQSVLSGTVITITGVSFGSSDIQGNYVGFSSDTLATAQTIIQLWTDTQIICMIPSSVPTGAVNVYVHNNTGGNSNTAAMTVSASPAPQPSVTPTIVPGNGIISGTVTSTSGTALHGATVTLGVISVTTDASGNYILENVPVGSQTVVATMSGYYDYNGSVTVIESQTATLNITMVPNLGPNSYSFLRKWGTFGSGDGQFNAPYAIAVDSSSNVYITDTTNFRIQKFDSSGTFITKWGYEGNFSFLSPEGIAVDSSGNVYVTDSIINSVQKFDSNGNLITRWGATGSENGNFFGPIGIAIDSSNNIYVADAINNRIQKFDSSGTFITKWGTLGSEDGQFSSIKEIAVDSSGNIYVADQGNNRIQKFDSSGKFLTKWGTIGSGDGQFIDLFGIAADSAGNIFVTDSGNSRIQQFDSTGKFLTKWGVNGLEDGQFNYPKGLTVDSTGKVYIVDSGNNRIQVFQPLLQ